MRAFRALLLASLATLPNALHACAVCGGSDDVKLVGAANTVLWTLLGLVAGIFVGTGSAIFFFWKKARTHSNQTNCPPNDAA